MSEKVIDQEKLNEFMDDGWSYWKKDPSIELNARKAEEGEKLARRIGPSIDFSVFDNLTNIGRYQCQYISSLNSVIIPEGIVRISQYAFAYTNLGRTVLPSTITILDTGAFYSIPYGSSINNFALVCKALTPPTLDGNVIATSVLYIQVPYSSLSAYTSDTNWASFADKIISVAEVTGSSMTFVKDLFEENDKTKYRYTVQIDAATLYTNDQECANSGSFTMNPDYVEVA